MNKDQILVRLREEMDRMMVDLINTEKDSNYLEEVAFLSQYIKALSGVLVVDSITDRNIFSSQEMYLRELWEDILACFDPESIEHISIVQLLEIN